MFDCLAKSTATAQDDQLGLTKTYYALEMFCENLGQNELTSVNELAITIQMCLIENKLLPYLPELMSRLLAVLETSTVQIPVVSYCLFTTVMGSVDIACP